MTDTLFPYTRLFRSKGGIWAPDAVYYKGLYLLYYSYSTWGDPNPGIGLAVSEKPEGPFRDLGKVFLSKEIGVDTSIDAFFIEDEGTPYLFWGSFHGVYGVDLNADGTRVSGENFRDRKSRRLNSSTYCEYRMPS